MKGALNLLNARHVKAGMTLAEVNAVLGCLPGDYRSPGLDKETLEVYQGMACREWVNDEVSVWVIIVNDRVSGVVVDPDPATYFTDAQRN